MTDTDIYKEMREKGMIKDDTQNWEDFKIYTKTDIASPVVMCLDEQLSGLTKEEIIKAHDLLKDTGDKITARDKMKSPKVILKSVFRIRSLNDIKRHKKQLASAIKRSKN